jgi:hypothetical protein
MLACDHDGKHERDARHCSARDPRRQEAFLDVATITGEVCGNPTPELRKALEGAGVKVYTPLQTLPR